MPEVDGTRWRFERHNAVVRTRHFKPEAAEEQVVARNKHSVRPYADRILEIWEPKTPDQTDLSRIIESNFENLGGVHVAGDKGVIVGLFGTECSFRVRLELVINDLDDTSPVVIGNRCAEEELAV